MSNDDSQQYKVGYRRPPRSSQFRPGKSGNPKGRPKVQKKFVDEMSDELMRNITIRENGVPKTITTPRAVIKSMVNLAMKGNTKAIAQLMELIMYINRQEKERVAEEKSIQVEPEDEIILQRCVDSIKREALVEAGVIFPEIIIKTPAKPESEQE